jgi:hypothetical protein
MVSMTTTNGSRCAVQQRKLPGGNLMEASAQWATRPDDERFGSIEEWAAWARGKRQAAIVTQPIAANRLAFAARGEEVVIVGPTGSEARMSTHAFTQECQSVGAPAAFLRTLSPQTAATALGEAHRQRTNAQERTLLMVETSTGLLVRGSTSPRYGRIWDAEIADFIGRLAENGWVVPPARPARPGQRGTRMATQADVDAFGTIAPGGGTAVHVGDLIAPAGLYGSMHDCFAFLVDPRTPIELPGAAPLWRGVMVHNSEVGGISLELTGFLCDGICGNHIVWGARGVTQFRVIHLGDRAGDRFRDASIAIGDYARASAQMEIERTKRAMALVLGDDSAEVAESLAKKVGLPQRTLVAAIDGVTGMPELRGASPLSAWGIASGLTRMSQQTAHTDERVKIDRAAGKVIELAF